MIQIREIVITDSTPILPPNVIKVPFDGNKQYKVFLLREVLPDGTRKKFEIIDSNGNKTDMYHEEFVNGRWIYREEHTFTGGEAGFTMLQNYINEYKNNKECFSGFERDSIVDITLSYCFIKALDDFEDVLYTLTQIIDYEAIEPNSLNQIREITNKIDSFRDFIDSLQMQEKTSFFSNLTHAAHKLSEAQKKVFYYTYIENLDTAQILKKLNIKRPTYNSHLKSINALFGRNDDSSRETLKELFTNRPISLTPKAAYNYLFQHKKQKKSYKMY